VGLAAGDGGCLVWPISAGAMRAKRHLLTGDPITAEEAHALGLVTDLVAEPEDVLPTARALADRIAALPPLAVQGTKRALNHLIRQRYAEVMELSSAIEYETLISADLREAVAAIRDRKTPSYEGR
jgi:enoyl-CoA hydratase